MRAGLKALAHTRRCYGRAARISGECRIRRAGRCRRRGPRGTRLLPTQSRGASGATSCDSIYSPISSTAILHRQCARARSALAAVTGQTVSCASAGECSASCGVSAAAFLGSSVTSGGPRRPSYASHQAIERTLHVPSPGGPSYRATLRTRTSPGIEGRVSRREYSARQSHTRRAVRIRGRTPRAAPSRTCSSSS